MGARPVRWRTVKVEDEDDDEYEDEGERAAAPSS
jgi:hypothetical protein